MFKNVFSFKGRIRRMEYGISIIIATVISVIGDKLGGVMDIILIWLNVFFITAQGAKRCHDVGHNGWWQFIPFYGFLLIFIDGEEGINKYGSNPKKTSQKDD